MLCCQALNSSVDISPLQEDLNTSQCVSKPPNTVPNLNLWKIFLSPTYTFKAVVSSIPHSQDNEFIASPSLDTHTCLWLHCRIGETSFTLEKRKERDKVELPVDHKFYWSKANFSWRTNYSSVLKNHRQTPSFTAGIFTQIYGLQWKACTSAVEAGRSDCQAALFIIFQGLWRMGEVP